MNCETKNVIQVESGTERLVTSTVPINTKPLCSFYGGILSYPIIHYQFAFIMVILTKFVHLLQVAIFPTRLYKSPVLFLLMMLISFIVVILTPTDSYSQPKNSALAVLADSSGSDRTFSVYEGFSVDVTFLIYAAAPTTDTDFKVKTIETSGDVLDDNFTGELTYTAKAGGLGLLFTIPTKRDTTSTTNGEFTIEIVNTANFQKNNDSDGKYTITVLNYNVPVLSAKPSPSISEGSDAVFNLSSTIIPGSGTIPINYTYTTTGNFLKNPPTLTDGSVEVSVEFTTANSSTTGSFSLETKLDNLHGISGSISITLVANEYYTLGTTITTTVAIENSEYPEISITKEQSLTSAVEGEFFEIILTASLRPAVAIPITLSVSDGNLGYLSRFDPNPIMMPTTSDSLTVTVHIKALPAINPRTTFRITVGEDTTNTNVNLRYAPKAGSSFVEVDILNSDKPVVQITSTANESSVVESIAFTFTLTVTPPPATGEVLSIPLTLEPTSTPYLDANLNLTYEVDSTGMLDVTVPTNLQAPDVASVTIKLEIVSNSELYLIGDDYHKIEFGLIKVAETSKPIVSITSDSDGESVSEGQGFSFRLATFEPPTADLEVNLTISDDSGFIEPDLTNPFTIPTSGVLDVDVTTQVDTGSDEGGEIEISIAEHSNYFISGRDNQINITVLNISTVLSISAGDGPHTEGSTILFTVTGTGPLTNPVTIAVMLSETEGDNILTSSPLTMRVELSTAEPEKKVSFQTVKNGIHMLGGNLTASMTTTRTDVVVGPSISVAVEDADDTPSISISTQVVSVTEGATDSDGALIGAEITLTANNSVSNMELPITLKIDDGDHNFFANANPNPVVANLPARERSVTHTITPENDSVQEAPGEFTVTIQTPADNTNFTVAEAPRNMVSIQFVDDDIMVLPEVSVTPVVANVTEGNGVNVSFEIAVDLATTSNLMIRYELTDSGNFLDGKAAEFSEITLGSFDFKNSVAPFSHLISNDDEEEDAGVITFKILYEISNFTYRVDAENSFAEVFVIDNDNLFPRIDISAEDSVIEGEEITFTLTATLMENATIMTPLTIILEISQVGDYLTNGEGMRMVDIPTTGTMMHVERTKFLGISPANGMITAKIQRETISSRTYSLGPQSRKSVNIVLYDGPIVSVNAPTSSIVAGTPAIFDISVSTPNNTSATDVLINVVQTHDIIQWRIPRGISIPAGESSRRLQIPTRKNMDLPDDMEVSIDITFRESSDYRFREGTEATVMVMNSVTADSGPRISVADAVVNAILNLNQDDPEIPETVEQSPIAENVQPIVSIKGTEHVVAEGQPIQFLIQTQVTNSNNLIVNLIINGGQSFVNLTTPNQQVAIIRGQSSTLFALNTINDKRAEVDETVTISITEGEGYSIAAPPLHQAAVLISDADDRTQYNERLAAANRVLIPELVATTGVQSYQTMSDRVQMAFTNEEQFLFEVGGQSNPTEILKLGGQSLNEQVDLMELLRDDTEIAINLSSDNAVLNNTTAWLKSENQNIYNLNRTDSSAWSGDFYTGNFGIDVQLGSGFLLGIASSISEHEISLATEQTQEFLYTASYHGFNPYIAVNSPALNTQMWVSSNISSGYIDVDSENQHTHRFDSQYSTLTFGGESRLLSSDNSILDGISELNLTSQGWIAQQSIFGDGHFTSDLATSGHNIQVSLTGSHEFDITESGTLKPNVLVGIQTAKNDTEKVSGLEIGFGTTYSNFHGLTLEGSGRGFKGSEQQDYATTFTGSLNYNPNSENIGSQLKISPSWGYSATATQLSLWQSNLTNESNLFNHFSNGLQVKTEFSYGINILDGIGILTPFSAIDYSGSNFITYNIGNQFEIGNNSSFEVIGTHEIGNTNIINNKLQLQGIVRW